MTPLLKFISIILFHIIIQNNDKHSLTVTIENIKSVEGKMFVAVYNKEDKFLKTPYLGKISKIEGKSCTVTFEGLAVGTYAVSVYHDKNNNDKLDTNFLGIPKEDYGCSNNAKGIMSAPKWEDAKFSLKSNKTVVIKL